MTRLNQNRGGQMNKTRATSEQVDDLLARIAKIDNPMLNITRKVCLDWLDMQERERRLVAVVDAGRKFIQVCSEDNETRIRLWSAIHLASLRDALGAYDAEATDD
jgi:hypothetical protein